MKNNLSYEDWFTNACTNGIDWDNDPPPVEMLTEELCKAALENSPGLDKIPENLRTYDVCRTAVYHDDDALPYVPEKWRNEIWNKKDAITEQQWLDKLSWYDEPNQHYYLKLTKKLLTPEFIKKMINLNEATKELTIVEYNGSLSEASSKQVNITHIDSESEKVLSDIKADRKKGSKK